VHGQGRSHAETDAKAEAKVTTRFTLFVFSDVNISQGSVVTRLRCGWIFYYRFTRNLLLSLSVKKIDIGQHLAKLQAKI